MNHWTGKDDSDMPYGLADVVAEIRELLSDPESGKRVDAMLAVWERRIDAKASLVRDVHARLVARETLLRYALTAAALVVVCALGWQRIISGEALVGLSERYSVTCGAQAGTILSASSG